MLSQIFKKEIQTISFEDVQYAANHHEDFLIINTLKQENEYLQKIFYNGSSKKGAF
mgnify:CR=1 FL=1